MITYYFQSNYNTIHLQLAEELLRTFTKHYSYIISPCSLVFGFDMDFIKLSKRNCNQWNKLSHERFHNSFRTLDDR